MPRHSPPNDASDKPAGGAEPADEGVEKAVSKLPPKAVLDALPERVRISVVEAASFSGPLPPPTMLRDYEKVHSGSSERIFVMAEKEQDHRISWEENALSASTRDSKLGQLLGFWLALFCVGGGIYLALEGHTIVAIALIAVSALGLAGRFLESRAPR